MRLLMDKFSLSFFGGEFGIYYAFSSICILPHNSYFPFRCQTLSKKLWWYQLWVSYHDNSLGSCHQYKRDRGLIMHYRSIPQASLSVCTRSLYQYKEVLKPGPHYLYSVWTMSKFCTNSESDKGVSLSLLYWKQIPSVCYVILYMTAEFILII